MTPGARLALEAVGLAAEPGGIAVLEVVGRWSSAPGEVLLDLDAPGGLRRAAAVSPTRTDADGRWSARFAVRREVLQAARGCTLVDVDGRALATLEPPRPGPSEAPGELSPDPAALRFDLRQRLAAERRPTVAAGIRRLLTGLGEPASTVPALTARLGAAEQRLQALQDEVARDRERAQDSLRRSEAAERHAALLVEELGLAGDPPGADG